MVGQSIQEKASEVVIRESKRILRTWFLQLHRRMVIYVPRRIAISCCGSAFGVTMRLRVIQWELYSDIRKNLDAAIISKHFPRVHANRS
jgi:hypothetical protein